MRRALLSAALAVAAAAAFSAAACAGPRPFDAKRDVATQPLEGEVVEVPASTARGFVLVPTMLDGHGPFWFLLDTGAETMVVDEFLAGSLGVRIEERSGSVVTEAGASAGGTIRQVTFREVRVGNARFKLVPALAMDFDSISRGVGRSVHGIIGLPLLSGRLWSVDPSRGVVRIEDGALPAEGEHILPLGMAGGLPTVRIDVAGRAMDAIVDTGQRMGVSVGPEDAEPLRPRLRVIGQSVGQVFDGEVRRDVARLDGDVSIGGLIALRAPAVLLGRATRVGMEAFAGRVLTFDIAHRRMRAAPVAPQ